MDNDLFLGDHEVKICVTLGPSSSTPETIRAEIREGASLFRMNFAHCSGESLKENMALVRKVAAEEHAVVAVIAETKGPDIRTGPFPGGSVELEEGAEFEFCINYVPGCKSCCSVSYWDLPKTVKPGDDIYVEYGRIGFTVKEVRKQSVVTVVQNPGSIGESKVVTLPAHALDLPFLSYQDTKDIYHALQNEVDYIAISGVRNEEDMKAVKRLPGLEQAAVRLLVCVENAECVEHIDAILSHCHGALISRSNLMSNISLESVPSVQKMVISKCNALGKPVAVIHQMLTSMDTNPRPTRAEVTDCANAIYDGVDCICLTNPTSVGPYPIESVQMLSRIIRETVRLVNHRDLYSHKRQLDLESGNRITVPESVASSAVKTAWDIQAKAIVCFTESGSSAAFLSKYWPSQLVYCISPYPKAVSQLQFHRSCIPIVGAKVEHLVLLRNLVAVMKSKGLLVSGDTMVILMGEQEHKKGATNQFRIYTCD